MIYFYQTVCRLYGREMHMWSLPLAFAGMPGGLEWVVIGLVALLLFGKRLPGIARSLGQSFTEFKSGLAGTGETEGTAATKIESQENQF